ncbi:MAG: type II toxin-antitoxin system HipA family toxin [Methylomonas sp.]|jgi:serine/threonine-protein kinase HipA
MKRLSVYAGEQLVGYLHEGDSNGLAFIYTRDWLAQPNAMQLSPEMPLSEQLFRGEAVSAFFENLLPEGYVLDFISKAAQISAGNIFGLLERFGGDTAGALSILPEGFIPSHEPHYLPVTPESIRQWFERFRGIPLDISGEQPRMSLSGAQDKMAVFIDEHGKVSLPLGAAPSSHIIKPSIPHRQDIPNTAVNEAMIMTLAERIGMNTAKLRYSPELNAVVITRYDRVTDKNGRLKRLHQNDICQILGIPSGKKYEAEGGPSLKTCFEAVLARSAQPALDKKRLIEWVIFNVLTSNMDGHAKNLSLITNGACTQLAPFYDLVCTAVYPNLSRKLAFKIGGENRPQWLMTHHWERFAEDIAVKPKFVGTLMDDMIQDIELALPEVATELGVLISKPEEQQMIDKVSDMIYATVNRVKYRRINN